MGMRWNGSMASLRAGYAGQATVEAAFLIPVVFLLLLMIVQPGILLYDRIVMGAAASETCRLLATSAPDTVASCEAFARNRLAGVPPVAIFHVHEGDAACSWRIELAGDESSDEVRVGIETAVRPLPLLDVGASLLGLLDAAGNLRVSVECAQPTQPQWARETAAGADPRGWAGAWFA